MRMKLVDLMTHKEYSLTNDCRETMIGSTRSNDIALPDREAAYDLGGVQGLAKRAVNGIHCTIYRTPKGFELAKYDKEVQVRREEEQQEVPMKGLVLKHGDRIILGGAYSLEVEIEEDSPENMEVLE